MKKLLLSLFFVLNLTLGCLGAAESKRPEDTIYTLVSTEYITESDDIKLENGFRVTKTQLQKLSLGLPLTMIEEKEEDGNTIINFPQVRGEILHFILSLEPHINEAGTINREGINIEIDTLLSRPEVTNRLELISECIIALNYLDSQAILEIFIEQFSANIHVFDGNIGTNLNALSILQETVDCRVKSSINAKLLPYFLQLKKACKTHLSDGLIEWNTEKTQYLNTSDHNTIVIFDSETKQVLQTLVGHKDTIRDVSWSPDGSQIASASLDRTIRIWNAQNGTCTKVINFNVISAEVFWDPTGSKIAYKNYNNEIKIWNTKTKTLTTIKTEKDPHRRFYDSSIVLDYLWNKDGTKIISLNVDGNYRIWDINTNTCLTTLPSGLSEGVFFRLNPQETMIAIKKGDFDDSVEIWDINTGILLTTFIGHRYTIYDMSWNPEGNILATCSNDGTIKLWSTETRTLLRTIKDKTDKEFCSISWNPKYNLLVSTSRERTISIWNPNNANRLIRLNTETIINEIKWNKEGTHFYTVNDYTLSTWGTPDLNLIQQLITYKTIQNARPLSTEIIKRIHTLPTTLTNNPRFREIIAENPPARLPFTERLSHIIRRPAFWVPVTIAGSILGATIASYWQQG